MKKSFSLLVAMFLVFYSMGAIAEEPKVTLPLTETAEKLTYWIALDNWKAAPEISSYEEVAAYQELEKLTGVDVEFIHPVIGQEAEQFNLMVASGEYPDIIFYNWAAYPGGPEKAIADGVILPLNNLIDAYCPNVAQKVTGNPDIARTMATDDGTFFYFPYIHWNQLVVAGWTYQVRADRLAALHLELPETIDEWYTMLKALKEADPAHYPLATMITEDSRNILRNLSNAWGTDMSFYVDGQDVKYGPLDPAFKDYLAEMQRWYAEGLIDPEFTSMDITALEAKILNGDVSVWLSGLDFGRYLIELKDEHAITCVKFPVLNKGDLPIYNNGTLQGAQGSGVAISASCKNPELAAKWIDYHYSEIGHRLLNFGIEGQSYTMVNDTPTFTDEIVANPDGKSVELALVKYAMGGISEAMFHDPLVRFARMGTFDEQRRSIERTQNIDLSHKMPNVTPTQDESSRLANIMNEADTYLDECWVKFIKGQMSIEKDYDQFIKTLRDLGVEEAIEIYQGALTRYNAR